MKVEVKEIKTVFDIKNNNLTVKIIWTVMGKLLEVFYAETHPKCHEDFVLMCEDASKCLLYSNSENEALRDFSKMRLKHSKEEVMKHIWEEDFENNKYRLSTLSYESGTTLSMSFGNHNVLHVDEDGFINMENVKINGDFITVPWWKRILRKIAK